MTTAALTLQPNLEDVLKAKERLSGVVVRTPLLQLNGAEHIWLKPEMLQPVGSFKIRGIYNAVAMLSTEDRALGVCTISSGNTAQALSWAAREFGINARAIMPETAPQAKLEATRMLGGTPDLRPAEEAFRSLLTGAYHDIPETFIHPVADRDVMAGHGTIGLEIYDDLPDVETVYVPIGGGGLGCGIAVALKTLSSRVNLIGVQPAGCTPVIEGLKVGKPVIVDIDTFCDGVAVTFMFPEMGSLLEQLIDDIVTVEEIQVFEAIKLLALKNKLVAEGAGALAVAAAMQTPAAKRGKSVAVISGGSIDPDKLASILLTGSPHNSPDP